MDRRRLSLSLFGSALLAACGGGGSAVGDSPQAGAVAMLSQPPVAAWGDSHTSGFAATPEAVGYASVLAGIAPGRPVFDGGVAGETSTQIAQRQTRDSAHRGWASVFWYGGNNQWDPDTIAADIARSVASLEPDNGRYLVLPVLNQAVEQERRGGWLHARIIDLNAQLARTYGDRFLDVRQLLVDAAGDTPQDQRDRRDDVPPSSLRSDGVHLNRAGYGLVARAVLQALETRGW